MPDFLGILEGMYSYDYGVVQSSLRNRHHEQSQIEERPSGPGRQGSNRSV